MRNQFTFFRSYWEAVEELPPKDRNAILVAICEYALDGKSPEFRGTLKSIFTLIKPTLDASAKKAEIGQLGGKAKDKQSGSKSEAKPKQSASKEEAKAKQNGREIEIEIEKEIEKEIDREEESESSLTRAGAREELAGCLPEGIESIESYYEGLGQSYREPKARIALMRAVNCRKNGNEDEAQRWAALAAAGGLRVNTRALTAP